MRLTPEKDLRKIHLPVAPFETPCNPKPNFSPFYLCEVFVLVAPSVSAWFKHQPAARKSPVSMSCNRAEQLWFHDQSLSTVVLYFCCLYWPSKDVFVFHDWTLKHFPELYTRISGSKKNTWATELSLKNYFLKETQESSSRLRPHKNFWIQRVHITNSMHFRICSFSIMFNSAIKVNMLNNCNYPPTPSQVLLRLMAPGPVPWICWHHVVLTYSCMMAVCQTPAMHSTSMSKATSHT